MECHCFFSDDRHHDLIRDNVIFDAFLSKNTSGDFACSISTSICSVNYCSFTFTDEENASGFFNSKAQRERFAEYHDFPISHSSKQDSESGYHYFGARYYDSELLTGWLSVDPMSDKYPSLSPYNYCAWTRPTGGDEHRWIKYNTVNNPVKLVDENGDSPTQKKAQRARNRAVRCFGDDRVGSIRNLGTSSNPNFGFDVYGKGRDKHTKVSYDSENVLSVIAYRPDETVTSGLGLLLGRLKHRSYQFDISCSVGAQASVEVPKMGSFDINLCSAEVFNLSLGTDGCVFSTIKDNNANCSSSLGFGLGPFNVSGGVEYSGGEYIDKDSVKPYGSIGFPIARNSDGAKMNQSDIDITGSKGKMGIGFGVACIFGIRISLSSEAQ